MRKLRTGTPQSEMRDVDDIMSYLGCDKTTAKRIMENCRSHNNLKGYGSIEKHLILDFINMKQRDEREREARYSADLAKMLQVTILEEQVKALKEQTRTLQSICDSNSVEARKARTQSMIANFISGISIAIAILASVLK